MDSRAPVTVVFESDELQLIVRPPSSALTFCEISEKRYPYFSLKTI